ncbi:EcoKI restriction-modification system protein HsdS [Candidatus Ornithobacterium hominis]|uniref:restriction endonuclease subunit S n=1 Tax=Candidatus Ornithobacterium hominis TaxID=2497989 RepID=UPI000E5B737F|nr:restriction endonuclease subunit S [Candidatus Ornithobacterium hominis]SZD73614.1 EcoKI restriction-modification system protein HsdS [Candidatus Ornithobacterium hominis]
MIVNTFEDKALNSIPKNWKLDRVKNVANIYGRIGYRGYTVADIVSEGDGALSISPGNIFNDTFTLKSKTFISWDKYYESPEIKIFEKDIILVKTGSTIGKAALVPPTEYKLTLNPQVVVLKKIKIDNSFLYYVLISDLIKYYFECFQSGGATPAISQEKINNFKLFYPSSLSEQQAIAHYLDAKTQAIDKKITLLEQKIETYKQLKRTLITQTITKGLDKNARLKDSGISWIGQIPQHWEVKRFKDVVSKYTTGGTPSTSNRSYFEGDNIWISIGDIGDSKYISDSSIYLTDEAIKDANIVKTPKGSLLYSFKLSIGKMAFTTKDVYTNEAISSIFPNKNIDLEYYYFMLPTYLELAATENIYGAKMLNQKLIANALVIHPPKSEQEEIAQYLDHKTATIDAIVSNISKQIDTLKQLRKTLINDVVTGKIKVCDD